MFFKNYNKTGITCKKFKNTNPETKSRVRPGYHPESTCKMLHLSNNRNSSISFYFKNLPPEIPSELLIFRI
jgi:hypothetical protein